MKNELVFEAEADEAGKVIFQKVPIGNYTIKVDATEDSNEAQKQVQIFIEEEKVYEKSLFIGVSLKRDQSVKFNFLEFENNTARQTREVA